MGFFDFLSGNESASDTPKEQIVKGQDSTFPQALIKRLKPHVNDTHMQLYCHIVNEWTEEVEIDKIRIFGMKRELDTTLSPHEEREFLVYDGPVLMREDHEAELDYKTKRDGDYFRTVYNITFAYNSSDSTYLPSEAHLDGPVRDIYE
jgi:hypothetical protein